MNQQNINALRGMEAMGPAELAQHLRANQVRFSASELIRYASVITSRCRHYSGMYYVPEWLAHAFGILAEGAKAEVVCDPWAGIGILIGYIRDAAKAKMAVAITRSEPEADLGRALVPGASWQATDPIGYLQSTGDEFDIVTAILPMSAQRREGLEVVGVDGGKIEVRADLGEQVLVLASVRLSREGLGLFVVTPSFFYRRSTLGLLASLGLGVEAAFALPPGTLAPYVSTPAYLLVIRKSGTSRMFVGQLSSDAQANTQVIRNYKQRKEGGTLELGRFVDVDSFSGMEPLRVADRFAQAEREFGAKSVPLGALATAIKLGRFGTGFTFAKHDNAVFVPLIGVRDVVDSTDDFVLKAQNYAQVVIDPSRSDARFVARFLNCEFGREVRQIGMCGVIPKLNTRSLRELRVFVPDLDTQRRMLDIEARIAAERNILLGVQSELAGLQRDLWRSPRSAATVEQKVSLFSKRLSGSVREHAESKLAQWTETLPFPLASILRAWQATPSQDFKARYEHLLHFFEATAEFTALVLLSAFCANEGIFASHRRKLNEVLLSQHLSFERATFGTWRIAVEYLGKQTRELLAGEKSERDLCAEMFSDATMLLPTSLSSKELVAVLSAANKMRNDWTGHGGIVGHTEARLRNERLIEELQKLRDAMADAWFGTQLISSLHCRPKKGVFEHEVAVLMGSNNTFVKETRAMSMWLEIDSLYLAGREAKQCLRLLPLIRVGSSSDSEQNICYFYSRLVDRDDTRFVSYHFPDKPEMKGCFDDVTTAIKTLVAAS